MATGVADSVKRRQLNPPSKNFADIQLSAEYVQFDPLQAAGIDRSAGRYVAYAISYLAAQSPGSGHKINYIGYSVGAGILVSIPVLRAR